MTSKVKIDFSKYPEIIESGCINLDEDKIIKLFSSKGKIVIKVVDNSFGGEYVNDFVLDFETAKDFYDILYRLLKQIDSKMKGGKC